MTYVTKVFKVRSPKSPPKFKDCKYVSLNGTEKVCRLFQYDLLPLNTFECRVNPELCAPNAIYFKPLHGNDNNVFSF